MTKFNSSGKDTLTYGEALDPAMGITTQEDADQYLKDYIAYIEKWPLESGETAEQIAKITLGYYAGYCDNETRERVERLFKCSHPIFGKVKDHVPTDKEAFALGVASVSKQKSEQEDP